MKLIDGKATAERIYHELKQKVERSVAMGLRRPGLAAVLIGNHPASRTYVNAKMKTCDKIGFFSWLVELNETVEEEQLLSKIEELNNDENIDGFIVQLPLPVQINEQKVISAIDPSKDVDGFHPINIGKMVLSQPSFIPATPMGILELLKRNAIETKGKHCVVMGRSNIVGTPLSILLSRPGVDATVTLIHSKSQDVKHITQQADILIAAVGRPLMIDDSYIKQGSIVIDVGIHRVEDSSKKSGFRLCGDVNFEKVKHKCEAITPVPGGVGPMTIAALMLNTFQAYQRKFL
ncbi:MAG: bifunctional protein FolD [Vicingaceae bacterium]|nr:MAG: bifunctional protein FolD [Vicingaceae bacterium]